MRFLPAKLSLLATLVLLAAGCGGGEGDAAAATPDQGGRGGGAPADAGGRGGRGGAMITLAESDITLVKRGSIEEGTPITGNLSPIETVEVRARIEGDIISVLAREG